MMTRTRREGQVFIDEDGVDVEPTDRQTARLEHARALSRRQQALLAAAGEAEPERRWYVLRVMSGAENSVDNALAAAGVERWLPRVKLAQKGRRGRSGQAPEARFELAWRGYIFVRVANTARCWAGLSTLDDVISVLGTADRPAPVSDQNVFRYKLFLEEDVAAREVLSNALKVGEQVRVDEGPFASFPGTVVEVAKGDRVRVEVMIFGRATLVELDLAQVAKSI